MVYGQETLEGTRVWADSKAFHINANSAQIIAVLKRDRLDIPLGNYLFINAVINGTVLPSVTRRWKDISWSSPEIKLEILSQEFQSGTWQTRVSVKAKEFIRLFHLICKTDQTESEFSDNYFDMPSGNEREIMIRSEDKIGMENLMIGHWLTTWE